jgi:hypothetical protein
MSDLSLMAIIGADPDFGRRISKKVEEIKHDKKNLLHAADDYGQKYRDEILEGTEKRNRMLTEGAQRGLSEEEVISQYGRFVPTVYTPILNLLYFLLRETADEDADHYRQRDRLNEQFGHLREEDIEKTVLQNTPDLEEFLYGNVTFDMFDKIKKLKALSKSSNKQEAFLAYSKAVELCKEYGLNFDKIPCYVKGQDEE